MSGDRKEWKKVRQSEGHISVDPLPTEKELTDFYAEQYYQQTSSRSYQASYSDQEIAYKRLYSKLLLHTLDKNSLKQGGLLEVGCGEGFLLAEAAECSIPVMGIDFSRYAIERFHPELRERVMVGEAMASLDQISMQGRRFGACVMQNVLEHVRSPDAVLEKLKSVLTPGAKVAITLPNDFSRVQKYLLETAIIDHEYWFAPPQHLHYFDIEGASALVRKCGYDVVDVFADFPIEAYLFHPGSNYVKSRDAGPAAHRGRMAMSLLCARARP